MGKPKAKLLGEDGNIFNILGICTTALKRANQKELAADLQTKVFNATSYDEALAICMEYVDVY
jgi:hypothetical protein